MNTSSQATIQFDGDDNDCQQLRNYSTKFDIYTSYNNDVIYWKLDYIDTLIAVPFLDQFWRCRENQRIQQNAHTQTQVTAFCYVQTRKWKSAVRNVHRTMHDAQCIACKLVLFVCPYINFTYVFSICMCKLQFGFDVPFMGSFCCCITRKSMQRRKRWRCIEIVRIMHVNWVLCIDARSELSSLL